MLDYSKKKRSVVREGEKNRWGSREECFILVVVIVITKKNRWISSRFHHGWPMVGSWLVGSEGEQLVTMDERSG